MQSENRARWEKLQALTQPVSKVIPFSIPWIEYAIKHLYTGGLFADGGATLLEKLYICWDSDMGQGRNGMGDGICGPGLVGCQGLIV